MSHPRSDELGELLAGLRTDLGERPLPSAHDVRRKGERRVRRQAVGAVVAGVAALAALVPLGGAAVTALRDPGVPAQVAARPSPASSVPPSPAAAPLIGAGALLTAGEMPQWSGQLRWREVSTGAEVPEAFACQRATLGSLGATDVVERTFKGQGTDGAHLVAAFPTAQDATLAGRAVEGWLADCESPLFVRTPTTAQLSAVTAGGRTLGHTWSYGGLLVGGDETEGRFDFVGTAATDRFVTVLVFTTYGADANFLDDPLLEPMQRAVARVTGRS
jgi:hypothetical protein